MKRYNPKDWFGLIFKFHKSDTFRKLFWVIVCVAVYSGIVTYIELEVFGFDFKSTTMHSLLGFVISLLLVFRTNTAYDRWWEGRKQWGALVNVCRNYTFKLQTMIHDHALQQRMVELVQLYPFLLKEHLRKQNYDVLPEKVTKLIPDNTHGKKHLPNAVAIEMQRLLSTQRDRLSTSEYLTMLEDLNKFTDICGACERILKTPIPYNYNIFIKKFIFAYIITMPISFAGAFGYWSILATAFTFYTLTSLEIIAESIEDPFGDDMDDLPTDGLAETIYGNLEELSNRS